MIIRRYIHRNSNLMRRIAVSAISVCLITGLIVVSPAHVYAASSFTSDSPFSGTNYGKGTNDSTYTHNSSYADDLIVNGVDASYWQDNDTDWTKAKKKGVDFVILRVSYTSLASKFKTNIDSHFQNHYNKLRKAGTDLIGVYAYSQARTEDEAAAEARFAVKRLKALGIGPEDLELPVYMDYEFGNGRLTSSISMAAATKCAKAFCEVIRNAGYKPGIYASTNFYKNYINLNALGSDVDIWCAQYYYKNTLSPVYSKWQYSSTAKIDGILSTTGSTDVNFWYIDKTGNTSGSFRIYGNTYIEYTGSAVKPSFDVYYGKKLLKEGKDYTVCGITNVKKSTNGAYAYAYILGIGNYSGYAVIPFSIGSGYEEHIGLDNSACKDSEGLILSNKHIIEEITKYLVRFVQDDGTDLVEPAYYENGTSGSDVEVPAPEKEGFTFTGWLDADGNNIGTDIPDVTGPTVYKAAFEAVPVEDQDEEQLAETVNQDEAQTTESAGQEELAGETVEGETVEGETAGETADATEEPAAVTQTASEETQETADVQETADKTADDETEDLPLEVIESVDTGETYFDLTIGYNSNGSYVRNVPANTNAADLVNGIEIRDEDGGYSLKVITAANEENTGIVQTGDMLGVYNGDDLVGTADITVNGSTLNDIGSVSLKKAVASKVTVAKTYIKKLKKYKKAFKVTVKQRSSAYVSGYQVRYSTKKNMTGAKIKTISSSYSKVTKKIKGLKSKKKYYVQVRTYKIVNGKKYYSSWSARKTVKTK